MVLAFNDPMTSADQTKLFLYVDFRANKILLSAMIKDIGWTLLLGKEVAVDATTAPPRTNNKYIFFKEVRDLNRL